MSWLSPCTTSMLSCVVRLPCRRRARDARRPLLIDRGSGSRAAKYYRHLELAVGLRSTHRLDDGVDPCHHNMPHSLGGVTDAVGKKGHRLDAVAPRPEPRAHPRYVPWPGAALR